MIRNLSNSDRSWKRVLFILAACAAVGSWADRAVADPADLHVFDRRPSLRGPQQLALTALLYERPIIIGPVPGLAPSRSPRSYIVARTPRGPRVMPRPRRSVFEFNAASSSVKRAGR